MIYIHSLSSSGTNAATLLLSVKDVCYKIWIEILFNLYKIGLCACWERKKENFKNITMDPTTNHDESMHVNYCVYISLIWLSCYMRGSISYHSFDSILLFVQYISNRYFMFKIVYETFILFWNIRYLNINSYQYFIWKKIKYLKWDIYINTIHWYEFE